MNELNPIAQAVAQAQEQLHLAMEAKQAEDLWWWMEKGWEDQMLEKDRMRVSDKKLGVVAAKAAMVEIERKWLKVSIGFSSFSHSEFDLFSRS